MAKSKPIKVCLTNQGKDTETPWADDLGAAPGPSGSRKVRLINVPFMHAKPTWGDVIVVSPVEDGLPTWDRNGTPWPRIGTRLVEDGGRWAMIVDYVPHPDTKNALEQLARACAEHDVVCEEAWAPRKGERGRTYLAVTAELTDVALMTALRAAELPCELIQVHPEPAPAAKKIVKRAAATKTPTTRAIKKAPTKSPPKRPAAQKSKPKKRA